MVENDHNTDQDTDAIIDPDIDVIDLEDEATCMNDMNLMQNRKEIQEIRKEIRREIQEIQDKVITIVRSEMEEIRLHREEDDSQDPSEPGEETEPLVPAETSGGVPAHHSSQQIPQWKSTISQYGSMVGRLIVMGSVSPTDDLNTGTLGMYTVAAVTHSSASTKCSTHAWLSAVVYLAIVLLAVFAFDAVTLDVIKFKCKTNDECQKGMYCSEKFCKDCSYIKWYFSRIERYYPTKMSSPLLHVVTPSTMPSLISSAISSSIPGTNTMPSSNLSTMHSLIPTTMHSSNMPSPTIYKDSTYCSNPDNNELEIEEHDGDANIRDTCNYLGEVQQGMQEPSILILFIFLSILWMLPICKDVEEACIEEIVLDNNISGSWNIPEEILRIALRIRKFLLPWYATSCTISLVLMDDLSAKNEK